MPDTSVPAVDTKTAILSALEPIIGQMVLDMHGSAYKPTAEGKAIAEVLYSLGKFVQSNHDRTLPDSHTLRINGRKGRKVSADKPKPKTIAEVLAGK